nr:hypothetical protein BaRGS_005328 [Batillaria attramentaria]
MTEVKNLTIRVEEQKLQFERQISELQDEVRMLREQDVLGNLERENEQLQDLLEQTREEVKVAQDDYRTLAVQYKNLEKELAYATRPIILTPPLPPPPPPLDLVQLRLG